MKYFLHIKEEANIDFIEAYKYYESKSIGLGERFIEQIDIFLELILQNPSFFLANNLLIGKHLLLIFHI